MVVADLLSRIESLERIVAMQVSLLVVKDAEIARLNEVIRRQNEIILRQEETIRVQAETDSLVLWSSGFGVSTVQCKHYQI